MTKLVVYGLGDFAKAMRFYFERDTHYRVEAYCADSPFIEKNVFDGLPVVAFEDVQDSYPSDNFKMFVAVGYSNMRARKVMYINACKKNYTFVNYISPHANIDASTIIGVNNVVLQGTQIEPLCTVGNNNIIWSSVNICHDTIIGSHCFFASQSLMGGFSKAGDNCFVGFNATVIQHVTLADETLVGTKSLILNDTKPYSKNIGIPAKCVSFHFEEGIVVR